MGDKGGDVLVLIRVAEKAGALVADDDVLVLVNDVQLGPEYRQEGVILGGSVKEFVVDVQLEKIPCVQPVVPLRPLAVDLYPL